MDNIISYKAPGLCYINEPISAKDQTISCQLILNLKGLTKDTKKKKIFISIKKDSNGNFILYYKKKFHYNTSIITDYLAAVLLKQSNKNILHIFDPYHQTLAKEVIWDKDSIPKNKEQQELEDDLDNQLDQVEIIDIQEDLSILNKQALEEVEEISINTFATATYRLAKKVCN